MSCVLFFDKIQIKKGITLKHEMPNWDLSYLYKNNDAAYSALAVLNVDINEFFNKYSNQIKYLSPDDFACSIEQYEQIEESVSRLSHYAYMQYAINLYDKDAHDFYNKVRTELNISYTKVADYKIEVANLDEKELDKKLSSNTTQRYRPWLEKVALEKESLLPSSYIKDEEYISSSDLIDSYNQVWADLRFHYKGQELCEDELNDKMDCADDTELYEITESWNKAIDENIDYFAFFMNRLALNMQIEGELKGYKTPLSQINAKNQVDDDMVRSLEQGVKKNYNISHRYYKIVASCRKMKSRNPLLAIPVEYSWNEAKSIIFNAYNDFSPTLGNIANDFFDNNWIDAKARNDKIKNDCCMPPCAGAPPYLLLNFSNKLSLDDVLALAHEMGHGLNNYLSSNQGHLQFRSTPIIAETFAYFGEILTYEHILKQEKNSQQKFVMMAKNVSDMVHRSIRQIALHEFENTIHTKIREQGELSPKQINQIWTKTQKQYLGPTQEVHPTEWCSVSDFIVRPLNSYSYAFGICLANSLYHIYKNNEVEDFSTKYVEMLSKGGTQKQKELLLPFGIDASMSEFWGCGMKRITALLDELSLATSAIKQPKAKSKLTYKDIKSKKINDSLAKINLKS